MERMMEKDPVNRISIDGIRVSCDVALCHQFDDVVLYHLSCDQEHPWIRKSGVMIPSKSQNCLELIDPHKDEVNSAVKKTTYPIYILVSGSILIIISLHVMSLDANPWDGKETFTEKPNG